MCALHAVLCEHAPLTTHARAHLHAKRPQLNAQRVCQSHDGALGGAVDASQRHRREAGQRADVQDAPAALARHVGHHRLAHAQESEHVHVKGVAHNLQRHLCSGAQHHYACSSGHLHARASMSSAFTRACCCLHVFETFCTRSSRAKASQHGAHPHC